MTKIKINQIYKANNSDYQLIITGKKGSKWTTAVLTDKPGVYNGTHKMSEFMLRKRYTLVQ